MHWTRSLRVQLMQIRCFYGVEVKFYNMEVSIDENLETRHKGRISLAMALV